MDFLLYVIALNLLQFVKFLTTSSPFLNESCATVSPVMLISNKTLIPFPAAKLQIGFNDGKCNTKTPFRLPTAIQSLLAFMH